MKALPQTQWGIAPGTPQPIDPAPLRLPIAPQWGYRTARQMPRPELLAKGHYYGVPFTFPALAARGTAQVAVPFSRTMQAWGWTAYSSDAAGLASFTAYITHQLANGAQRLWTPRRVTAANVFGTAQFPAWFKSPQFLFPGEVLQMEISSVSTAAITEVQILLHCTMAVAI